MANFEAVPQKCKSFWLPPEIFTTFPFGKHTTPHCSPVKEPSRHKHGWTKPVNISVGLTRCRQKPGWGTAFERLSPSRKVSSSNTR